MSSSLTVANKFLKLAEIEKNTLTPIQLIKLVYMAHGWMLALYNRPLIDDDINAWQYGLTILELYHRIEKYGSQPVEELGTIPQEQLDEDQIDLIKQVYVRYGNYSGIKLSMLTNTKRSPWYISWHNGSKTISNDLIQHYYKELVDKYGQRKNS